MLEFKTDNGKAYAYKDGQLVKGWVQDEKKRWFHMNDKDGRLDVGWFQTGTDDDKWFYSYPNKTDKHLIGEMATGWIEDVDHMWYYCYTKPTQKDGQSHCTGEMATGWIQDGIDWYYLYPERTTNYGITYPKGAMAIDWVKLGDKQKWYYLLKTKTEYNGNTHYKGACVSNTTLNINGQDYKFDANGVWQSNATVAGDSLVTEDLVKFVAGWEDFYSKAYADPYYGKSVQAYWTIGYGTCYCAIPEAFPNGLDSTCTEEQALGWLMQEINKVAVTIKSALGSAYSTLSQQAFDCLCDIGYNAGTGALIGGNTWKSIISGDAAKIEEYVMSWNHANGQLSEGLDKRCRARVKMCLEGIYDSTH